MKRGSKLSLRIGGVSLQMAALFLTGWLGVGIIPCVAGGYKAIHQAAALGNDEVLYDLIRDNPSCVHAKDESNNTPLHISAQNLRADSVLRFLNAGADYLAKNDDGYTALHLAILHGDNDEDRVERRVKIVTILLMQGSAVAETDKHGRQAIHIAAIKGRIGATNVLIRAGASLSASDVLGRKPMHYAALHGHVGLINSLVNHKVKVSVRDKAGLAPLHYAARGTQLYAVKRLLQLGASASDVTQVGLTTLHMTADANFNSSERENRAITIADLLIEKGADVSARDKSDRTAADFAITRKHTRLAQRLQ